MLSAEKIEEIKKEYSIIGTYAGVAKKLGVSAASVKKYTQKEDTMCNKVVKIMSFPKSDILPLDKIVFPIALGEWLVLTEEDKTDIEELRKEIHG